jgi:hypothetical protein
MAAININNLINLLQTIQKEQNPTKIIRIRLRDAVDNDRTDEKNLLMLALDFLKKQPDLTTLEDWPPQQFTFALFTWLQSKACTHKDKNTLAIDCLGQYLQLTLTISQPDSNQLDTALHAISLDSDSNQGLFLLESLVDIRNPALQHALIHKLNTIWPTWHKHEWTANADTILAKAIYCKRIFIFMGACF